MIYVASPYNHDDPAIVNDRITAVKDYFVELFNSGECAVSPMLMGHELVQAKLLSGKPEVWEQYCKSMMVHCHTIHVIASHGWISSKGLQQELGWAREFDKAVVFVERVGEGRFISTIPLRITD